MTVARIVRLERKLLPSDMPPSAWARFVAARERAHREAPPIDAGAGLVDVEPTIRRIAELLDADPDEAIDVCREVLAERQHRQTT